MWNFDTSYTGLSIMAGLILFSFSVEFIYKANLKYKYRKYNSTIKLAAARYAKKILKENQKTVIFKFDKNYFKSEINYDKRYIRFDYEALFNASIYDQVNSLFLVYKYLLAARNKKTWLKYQGLFNIFNSILMLNLLWTLALGLWILVAIIASMIFIFLALWVSLNYTYDKRASKLTWENLKVQTNHEIHSLIKSWLKYKKFASLSYFLVLFAVPFISFYSVFKAWGSND